MTLEEIKLELSSQVLRVHPAEDKSHVVTFLLLDMFIIPAVFFTDFMCFSNLSENEHDKF